MLLNGRRNVGLVIRVGIWYFNIGFVCEIDRNKLLVREVIIIIDIEGFYWEKL